MEDEYTKEVDYYEIRIENRSGISKIEKYDSYRDLQDRFEALLLSKSRDIKHFRAFIVFNDDTYMEVLNSIGDRINFLK